MDIKYLNEFIVLAETGNFSEAADLLFLSQSSLSKHIQSIEKELGVQLFDRTTRTVTINKFGNILLPYARQIIKLKEQCESVILRNVSANEEILTVGSIRSLAQYRIIDIIANFKVERPQSEVKIFRAEADETHSGTQKLTIALREKKCDLAFIRDCDGPCDDLVKIPYARDILSVLFPSDHPTAKMKSVPLKTLAEHNFLFLEENSGLHKLCVRACEENGFTPKVAFTDSKPENLVEWVINGMGIALLVKQLAVYLSNPEIAVIDITPTVYSEINLCYPKDAELSDAARRFIECTETVRKKFKLGQDVQINNDE